MMLVLVVLMIHKKGLMMVMICKRVMLIVQKSMIQKVLNDDPKGTDGDDDPKGTNGDDDPKLSDDDDVGSFFLAMVPT